MFQCWNSQKLKMYFLRFLIPSEIRSVFQNHSYRHYFSGYSATLLGNWIQRTGIGLIAWDLTRSEFFLGLVAFCELIPTLFFGPIGGAIGDRVPTKQLITYTQFLLMLQSILLAISVYTGFLTPGLLLVLVFLQGIILSFAQPAGALMSPALVDKNQIPTAIAISTMAFNISRFLGPMIAIVIVLWVGVGGLFLANSLGFVWYLWCLRRLRLRAEHDPVSEKSTSLWQQIKDGLSYSLKHAQISVSLLIVLLGTLFARPVIDMFPAFADKIFDHGARGFSWLLASMGIGAFLAGLFLSQFSKRYMLYIPAMSLLFIGISLCCFIASPFLWLGCIFSSFLGFSFVMNGIGCLMVIQSTVRPDMRSRAVSLYYLSFRGGLAAGGALLGLLSEQFGLKPVFIATAIICFFVSLALIKKISGRDSRSK